MAPKSVTFALEIGWYDSAAEADASKEVILATPRLEVFFSPSHAVAKKEGINIVEGDLWFFASDGSPLQVRFSQEPSFHPNRPTYFPGVYSLEPGMGESLQNALARIVANNTSPRAQIVVRIPPADASAQEHGWPNLHAMKEGATEGLQILPPDLSKRVVFDTLG